MNMKNTAYAALVAALVFLPFSLPGNARCESGNGSDGVSGTWSGKISAGIASLNIVFHICEKDGKFFSLLDSPDQNVSGIAADSSSLRNDTVFIRISRLMAEYEGVFRNDSICGTFRQSGMDFPLVLRRGFTPSGRPQTPVPPFGYTTEDVVFENDRDGASLAGTISYPVGYGHGMESCRPAGDVRPDDAGSGLKASRPDKSLRIDGKQESGPAQARQDCRPCMVVMVSGSGLQDRNEEIYGHKPFLVIADWLAENGIASLRYDDRGTGGSKGDVENATTEDFMRDALAAVRFAKQTGRFSRVGILGHSEGGTIAFMAAAESDDVDFVISLAGGAVGGDSILIWQNRRMLELSGVDGEIIDGYVRVLGKVLEIKALGFPECVKGYKKLRKKYSMYPEDRIDGLIASVVVDEIMEEEPVGLPAAAISNLKNVLARKSAWIDYFIASDPAEYIRKTDCPVLALNGSKDTQVDPSSNLAAIRENAPRGSNVTVIELPGLNHLFQHCSTGLVSEYKDIEETISPEVLELIADWILSL